MADFGTRKPTTRERRSGLNNVLVFVATVVLFFVLFGHLASDRLLFRPGPASYVDNATIVRIPSSDGTELAAFWGPVPNAKWTVLYFHGNAEDIGDVGVIINNHRLQGRSVLCFDYRGYGLTPGKASEKNTLADADAVYRYATETLGIPEREIVLHGRSLGGGVAMDLAIKRKPAALIMESSFLSVYRLYLPLDWVPGDKFENIKKAKKVACPTMFIHGRRDEVVPFAHAQELSGLVDASLAQTLWFEGGHNDLASGEAELYWAGIRRFVNGLR